MANRVCSVSGCPAIYPTEQGSRCAQHAAASDKARGTARERGYNTAGHQRFRRDVLDRDPICVACDLAQSTVADHYPHSRKELEQLGLDPNDPRYGRGVCKPCHDRSTAREQPGGWHRDLY